MTMTFASSCGIPIYCDPTKRSWKGGAGESWFGSNAVRPSNG